jgi:PAS domain S-box-containing protein
VSDRVEAAFLDAIPFPALVARASDGGVLAANKLWLQAFRYDSAASLLDAPLVDGPGSWLSGADRQQAVDQLTGEMARTSIQRVRTREGRAWATAVSLALLDLAGVPALLELLLDPWGTPPIGSAGYDDLATEPLLRSFVEAAPMLAGIKDLSGHTIFANAQLSEVLSPANTAQSTEDAKDLMDRAAARLTGAHESVRTSGLAWSGELELPLPEGQLRTYLMDKFPLRGPAGKLAAIGSMYTDITALKSTESALRASKQLLDDLVENLDEVLLIVEPHPTRVVYASPSTVRVLQVTPEFVKALPSVGRAVHPDDLIPFLELLDAPTNLTREFRSTLPNGRLRYFRGSSAPVRDDEGRVIRTVCSMVDITDEKLAEAALVDQQRVAQALARRLASALSALADYAVVIVGSDGIVELWNPAAERMLGYTAAEMIGRSATEVADLITVEGAAISPRRPGVDSDAAMAPFVREVRYLRRDGTSFLARVATTSIVDTDGRPEGQIGVMSDLTEVKRREAELTAARDEAERAGAVKDEFLSRSSHELRTPLNAILGFGQLLEGENLTDNQLELVTQVLRAGHHLLDLVGEILDLGQIASGEIRPSVEVVGASEVIDQVIAMVQPLAQARNVSLSGPGRADGEPYVRCDRQRLTQVLVNLLTNALKYNNPGGSVAVRVAMAGGTARLTVSDDGPGIAEADLDRLFQPFERLGAALSDVEGTGLGLALCRGLVEAMGGRIGVYSELGRGSDFWVELPMGDAASVVVVANGAPVVPLEVGQRSMTVLAIEDNPANLRLLEMVFASRPGVTLLSASSGSAGLELAQTLPDLVLLDLHLPDLTGQEILARLRRDPATESIPVVVLSADAYPKRIAELRELGVDDYLSKPLDLVQLIATVEHYR